MCNFGIKPLILAFLPSCSIPMDFLYQFSYGVRVNLGFKKVGAGGS
jgi:hypothetical protein